MRRAIIRGFDHSEGAFDMLTKAVRRQLSSLPEDLSEVAKRSKFPSRRASEFDKAATGENAASANETVQETTAQTGAKIASVWMAPWERRQLEGGALRPWEKLYWGVFVVAISLFLFNRLRPTPEEEKQIDEAREAKKMQMARLVLAGKSVIEEEDDLFDGLSPEEIQTYVEAQTGATSSDPFEGLSPEEINDYVEKHGLTPQ